MAQFSREIGPQTPKKKKRPQRRAHDLEKQNAR
jgi:hypothetical protein